MDSRFEAMGKTLGAAFKWYHIMIGILAVCAAVFIVLAVRMKRKKQKTVPRWISVTVLGISLAAVLGMTAILVFPV